MPGLQLGLTRKDMQHFPILTMTEKLSTLYIPEALRHDTECQDFSLGEPVKIHNSFLDQLVNVKKLRLLYIPELLSHYIECQDFSLGETDKQHFPILTMNEKLSML